MSDAKVRRWFITGVSTGLGRDLALAAVRGGHRVMGSVRQPDQIAALASDGIDAVLMDVNDQAQVEAAASAVVARMGGVDVLVNNAGFGLFGALEALSMDEIRGVMETNFFGVLRVTKALLPTLRLPLGADALDRIGSKLARLEQDMTNWREASLATAFTS